MVARFARKPRHHCPDTHTARIPPTLLISEWIGRIKGGSGHDINAMERWGCLAWQSGYGVVTFGTKDLAWVADYIRNQKQHHRAGSTFGRLEAVVEEASP